MAFIVCLESEHDKLDTQTVLSSRSHKGTFPYLFCKLSFDAQKTTLLSLKQFESSKMRPPRLRNPVQDYHLAAETPRGASPA